MIQYFILVLPAHKVLTENTLLIKDSQISLEYLADKMLERRVINDVQKGDIMDRMTGQFTRERIGKLLDILKVAVNADVSLFDWFVQVLREYKTVLTVKLAEKLEDRHKELTSEKSK